MNTTQDIHYDKIICDNGSGYLKMGYAGESFPHYTIPSIVGRPALRANQNVDGLELKAEMFGDEAAPLRSLLDISYPIKEGMIKPADWEDFEKLWAYTFKQKMKLGEDLSDKFVIVTEAAVQPKKNR